MKNFHNPKILLYPKTFFDSCVQKACNLITTACNQKNTSGTPECESTSIIIGLSGGPDSVFLLHVLNFIQKQNSQIKEDSQVKQNPTSKPNPQIKIIAVHLDHQWRAKSWRDVEFCSQLCKSLDIEFIARKADELNLEIKFNGSKEELGRKMRRALFKQILKEKNADFIALAHHLQDQQETFFIRLLRGSSLSGLCCMQEIDGNYIRPLLGINKRDILEYLDSSRNHEARSNQIKYLIDPTNISPDYLRNRIRSNVIPALEQCDERFNSKFQSTLEQLNLEDDFLKTLAAQVFNDIFEQPRNSINKLADSASRCARGELVEPSPIGDAPDFERSLINSNHWLGDLKKFKLLHPVLAKRVVLHWLIQEKLAFNLSTNYLDEIIRFLNSPRGGTHVVGQKWKIYKKSNSFGISSIEF
ncbi:MAG: tRNA lysidine(34) synthetase TilS [bacterium]